jgi:hypothetical protein
MTLNSDVIRNLYAAFARGDVPAVLGAMAPNISWTEAEGFPYGGTYVGPEAVLQNVFMKLGTEWDGFSAVPVEFIDGGNTVVALETYSGTYKTTDKRLSVPFAHVWKMEGGKVITFLQYTDTAIVQGVLR